MRSESRRRLHDSALRVSVGASGECQCLASSAATSVSLRGPDRLVSRDF